VASAGVAVSPGNDDPGVYVPVKSTTRPLAVSCCMEPPLATKVPKPEFDIEKPPPDEIEVIIRLNIPNDVIGSTIEKSPAPALEACESVPVNIVDVVRSVPFWVTLNPAKGMDPVIALACKTVVQIVIVASRNSRRVKVRRLMVNLLESPLCDSVPNRKLNCLGLYDSERE